MNPIYPSIDKYILHVLPLYNESSVNRIIASIKSFFKYLSIYKGFINVEVVENDKGYMEEFVSLDNFYNKLKLFMVDDINSNETKKINDSTIYETIEKEFGRTLSSIEYEIIRGWLEHNYSEEIIKEALKEAVLNGVSNLKYMDKILYEWGKKGIKSVEDVEKNRKKTNFIKSKF